MMYKPDSPALSACQPFQPNADLSRLPMVLAGPISLLPHPVTMDDAISLALGSSISIADILGWIKHDG